MLGNEVLDLLAFSKYGSSKMFDNVFWRSIIALPVGIFLPHQIGILVLLLLICIDTILGTWRAIRAGNFSSSGMKKTLVKLILYTLATVSVKLLDLTLSDKLDFLVNGVLVYLSLIEGKSIY